MTRTGQVTLVTGGARSGKSAWALAQASALPGRRVLLATAEARDEEMRHRILRHQQERGDEWETVETPLEVPECLRSLRTRSEVVLLDCLTMWVSNLMETGHDPLEAFARLRQELQTPSRSDVFLVTNEVGLGIVPENAMARQFRDLAGSLNQEVAAVANRVVLVVSGIPVTVKETRMSGL